MSLTKNKANTAAKTIREAVDSGEFPNSVVRSLTAAADALEGYAGADENDEG